MPFYDGNGNQTARNVYGTNLISRTAGGQQVYYAYNGHGDVTELLDNSGAVVANYKYDAFGTPIAGGTDEGGANNPYRYAGYQYDGETELYYLSARYYDSTTARFLQEDTYRGTQNDPLSLNLYTYCANNPIRYFDPTGHSYNGTEFNSFEEFFNYTLSNPQEAQMILYELNGTNQNYLKNIINDYVAYQGGMQTGDDNVFTVIYTAPPGSSSAMNSRNMSIGSWVSINTNPNMYDNYEFTLFDALNWMIQTGGSGNFALQTRVTDDPTIAADGQRHIVGKFMDARNFMRGAGVIGNNVAPQLYIGSTEGNGYNAIEIYQNIMETWWLQGNTDIIGGIYYGNEDAAFKFDGAIMQEVSSFIHGEGKRLLWKPYISEANFSVKMIIDHAEQQDGQGNPLFDFIMIQPSTFFSGNYGGIDDVFNEIVKYNNNPLSSTRVGMQIEFDMGLVTGRGGDHRGGFTPLQKRQFLNAYLDKVSALKEMGVPISVYSGGPNEQGYGNIRANTNTHNWGNHIPYWEGMPPADWYSTGVAYNHFPHNSYGGNIIYDLNNYIYNGKWNPALTNDLWLTPR